MSASVQVLCPNGRRQNVKITPNTKILQVLEEVCKKQGFLPAEEYDLKHGKSVLDISSIFRYSGLPNHAKLELVKAAQSRCESCVSIAVQLESGERLQHEFSPDTTLWDVLQHWEGDSQCGHAGQLIRAAQEKNLTPLCIYMREEITGQVALQHATLRSLGLTKGKAIFRLVHRQVDASLLDEIAAKINAEKARQAKLDSKHTSSVKASKSFTDTAEAQPVAMETEETKTTEATPSVEKPQSTTTVAESMETEVAPPSGSSLTQQINIPGVQVFRPGEMELTPEEEQVARRLLPGIFPADVNTRNPRPPPQRAPQPVYRPPPVMDFKFPEATKGKNVYRNELSDVKKEEFQPCDRQTTLFSLNEPRAPQSADEELPDDFFEVTVADVQRMMTDIKKKVDEESGQMLMTSAMRKAAFEEKFEKYKYVAIRIQFSDRMVLQGIFRPRETVHALRKYVKEYLEDKSLPFYLYTSPPRELLKDDTLTLLEAKLVPATVVYFGSEVSRDHYLSNHVLGEVSPHDVADNIAMNCVSGDSKANQDGGENSSQDRGQVKRAASLTASQKAGNTTKVPKWFMAGKR